MGDEGSMGNQGNMGMSKVASICLSYALGMSNVASICLRYARYTVYSYTSTFLNPTPMILVSLLGVVMPALQTSILTAGGDSGYGGGNTGTSHLFHYLPLFYIAASAAQTA